MIVTVRILQIAWVLFSYFHKISVILLTLMYLVALNLLVSNQLNSSLRHMIVTLKWWKKPYIFEISISSKNYMSKIKWQKNLQCKHTLMFQTLLWASRAVELNQMRGYTSHNHCDSVRWVCSMLHYIVVQDVIMSNSLILTLHHINMYIYILRVGKMISLFLVWFEPRGMQIQLIFCWG